MELCLDNKGRICHNASFNLNPFLIIRLSRSFYKYVYSINMFTLIEIQQIFIYVYFLLTLNIFLQQMKKVSYLDFYSDKDRKIIKQLLINYCGDQRE